MYEEILTKILGDDYENGREIGERILAYISENPDWDVFIDGHRVSVEDAINEALIEVTGSPLDFYTARTRKQSIADVRDMVILLLRKHTKWTLEDIGAFVKRDHTTVHHNIRTAYDNLQMDRLFKEKYKQIEQKFLERL